MRRRGSRDGATAVEFALLSPILIMMAAGITGYGGYFWISHSIQQVANDAARAAVAGLDTNERASLAQQTVNSELAVATSLDPARTQVTLTDNATQLTVTLAYDASGSPFWAMRGFTPMPSTTIVRQATIKLGGY